MKSNRGLNPNWTFSSFVPCKANESAFKTSIEVSANSGSKYNPLYIYGVRGLGKTHLLHAIGLEVLSKNPEMNILYLESYQFVSQMISRMHKGQLEEFRDTFRNLDVLLFDDVEFLGGCIVRQEVFLQIFNELFLASKQIVVTSSWAPKDIRLMEDHLKNRFASGMVVEILQPDLEARITIIRTKAKVNGYKLSEDVIHFLAETIKLDVRELEECMARLIGLSSSRNASIDLAFARDVLNELYISFGKPNGILIGIPQIQKTVAEHFSLKPSDLKSKSRNRNLVVPQQIAMYLCQEITGESLEHIGKTFGGHDDNAVRLAYWNIRKELETWTKIGNDVKVISAVLGLWKQFV